MHTFFSHRLFTLVNSLVRHHCTWQLHIWSSPFYKKALLTPTAGDFIIMLILLQAGSMYWFIKYCVEGKAEEKSRPFRIKWVIFLCCAASKEMLKQEINTITPAVTGTSELHDAWGFNQVKRGWAMRKTVLKQSSLLTAQGYAAN